MHRVALLLLVKGENLPHLAIVCWISSQTVNTHPAANNEPVPVLTQDGVRNDVCDPTVVETAPCGAKPRLFHEEQVAIAKQHDRLRPRARWKEVVRLLAQIGSAPYSVTKHAAVSFAEWPAFTHGADGLKVSVLCPAGLDMSMIAGMDTATVDKDGLVSPEFVAETVLAAIQTEQFLILPHPKVADYMQFKAGDPDRWIKGMQRWQASLVD